MTTIAEVNRPWALLPSGYSLKWYPYVFLLGLLVLFIQPAQTGDRASFGLGIVSVVLFLPAYFAGLRAEGRYSILVIAWMVLLGAALAPTNSGASVYFIYAASFTHMLGSPRRAVFGVLGIFTVLTLVAWATALPHVIDDLVSLGGVNFGKNSVATAIRALSFQHTATVGVLAVGGGAVFFAAWVEHSGELQAAREGLARAAERERIAADLHDLLGHSLTVITVRSELGRQLAVDAPRSVRDEFRQIETLARDALAEVRVAVDGYRGKASGSFSGEVDSVRRALEAAGIRFKLAVGPEILEGIADARQEGTLALALREATTNIIRHAKASSCTLTCHSGGDGIGFDVEDDGRGARGPVGNGLAGMRSRIEAVGGSLLVSADSGTALRLRLPPKSAMGE